MFSYTNPVSIISHYCCLEISPIFVDCYCLDISHYITYYYTHYLNMYIYIYKENYV